MLNVVTGSRCQQARKIIARNSTSCMSAETICLARPQSVEILPVVKVYTLHETWNVLYYSLLTGRYINGFGGFVAKICLFITIMSPDYVYCFHFKELRVLIILPMHFSVCYFEWKNMQVKKQIKNVKAFHLWLGNRADWALCWFRNLDKNSIISVPPFPVATCPLSRLFCLEVSLSLTIWVQWTSGKKYNNLLCDSWVYFTLEVYNCCQVTLFLGLVWF